MVRIDCGSSSTCVCVCDCASECVCVRLSACFCEAKEAIILRDFWTSLLQKKSLGGCVRMRREEAGVRNVYKCVLCVCACVCLRACIRS